MNTDKHRQRLSDTLELEIDAVKKLSRSLMAEYEAACTREVSALEQAVNDKQECLNYLEDLEQDRIFIVESIGFKPANDGMDNCLLACDVNGKITTLWQNLLSLARSCRKQNRINRLLVKVGSDYTHHALRVMRGEDPGPKLHGPNGDTDYVHDNGCLAFV